LDLAQLEDDIADGYGGFTTYRTCHHTDDSCPACCAGFWASHKDEFQLGQVAQRLGLVEFVEIDNQENDYGQ
jgi:hypothetical protein